MSHARPRSKFVASSADDTGRRRSRFDTKRFAPWKGRNIQHRLSDSGCFWHARQDALRPSGVPCCAGTVVLRGKLHFVHLCHSGSNCPSLPRRPKLSLAALARSLARPAGFEPATSGLETPDVTQKQCKPSQTEDTEGDGPDPGFQGVSTECLRFDSTNLTRGEADHLRDAQKQLRDGLAVVGQALEDECDSDR